MNRACFEWRSPPAPPPSRLDQLTLGMMRLAYVIYGALLAGMVALINLAVDALHALIDPRLTHARRLRAP